MIKRWFFSIITAIGLVLVMFMVYTNTPIICSQLVDERLHKGIKNTQNTIGEWIQGTYLFGELSFDEWSNSNTKWFGWYSFTNRYHTADNGMNQTLYQQWLYKDVQVKDVIRCLGHPTAYSSSWRVVADVNDAQFSLWYPERGYVFLGTESAKYVQRDILLDSDLFLVGVFKPDSLDIVLEKAYPSEQWGEGFVFDEVASLRDWPDPFQKIEIEPSSYFNQQ